MERISRLLTHDTRQGQLLLLGRPVTCESDLINLPTDEYLKLTAHFGVGFPQLCDAFELENF